MRLQRAMGGGADLEIAVDLSFPREVQIDNECRSLSKQLCHTYNYIKTAEVCTALHLTSFQGKIQDALQPRGGDGWMVHKHVCGLAESFEGREEDLVMLSPDATETLEGLEKGKIYVIGGIVDRTVVKGVTLGKAEEVKIPLAVLARSLHHESSAISRGKYLREKIAARNPKP
jgi:tRNA (guanine9-N1)-methyltransferase